MPTYFNDKEERAYTHIKMNELMNGKDLAEAKRIAAATVNKRRGKKKGKKQGS